jgi:catechol-2,3-dioxygenase
MKTVALVIPTIASSLPFTMRRLDHIVLRCADTQTMLDFYIRVLGAQPTTLANGESSGKKIIKNK